MAGEPPNSQDRLRSVVWGAADPRVRATWRVVLPWPVLWFLSGTIAVSAAGAIESVPRLYLVQAKASEPIAEAYREGRNRVTEGAAEETAAFSIVNKKPLSGNRSLAAARATDGAVLSVSEPELLEATARIADRAGLSVEPACAVTLAGARQLADAGEFGADDDVVLIQTGTGFKELAGVDPDVDVRTMTAGNVATVLREVAT
jgi:threonine synthase